MFEDPTLSSSQISESYASTTEGSNDQENGSNEKEIGQPVDVDVHSEPSSTSEAQIEVGDEIAKEITAHVGDLKVTDDHSADQSNGEDQHSLSTEDVDMLLEKCLLQALHTTIKDKDLPMPGSTLWYNMLYDIWSPCSLWGKCPIYRNFLICFLLSAGQTTFYLVGLQASHLTSRNHHTRNYQSGYKLNLLQAWCIILSFSSF